MAFCPNCGTPADGRYCAKCGTAINAESSTASGPSTPPGASAVGIADNAVCALCYGLLLVTGILFLVLEPYNKNPKVRFHAYQSIFLNVAMIAIWMAWGFLSMFSGGMLLFLSPVLGLGIMGLWIFMVVKTYQDQKIVLPVIGPLAEKQAMA
jgi:uncharacterized membrane protein